MCCNAVHTLKSNIAFVICDWLPNSACVWKKLFPEICFVIQFVCLLISFFQAASFCILYHADNRNVVLGNVFTEIHLVSPAVFPSSTIHCLCLLTTSFSLATAGVKYWALYHESCSMGKAYLDLASEKIIFWSFLQETLIYQHCTPMDVSALSTRSEFGVVIFPAQLSKVTDALSVSKHACVLPPHWVFSPCSLITSSLTIVLYLFTLSGLSYEEKPCGIFWS